MSPIASPVGAKTSKTYADSLFAAMNGTSGSGRTKGEGNRHWAEPGTQALAVRIGGVRCLIFSFKVEE